MSLEVIGKDSGNRKTYSLKIKKRDGHSRVERLTWKYLRIYLSAQRWVTTEGRGATKIGSRSSPTPNYPTPHPQLPPHSDSNNLPRSHPISSYLIQTHPNSRSTASGPAPTDGRMDAPLLQADYSRLAGFENYEGTWKAPPLCSTVRFWWYFWEP